MFPRMAGCLHGHLWCRTAGKERHGQGRKTDPQDLRSPMAMSVAVCIGYCDQNTCKWLQGQKWASAPPRKATDRAELCHDPAAVRSQVSMAQATMAAGNCTRCCRHSRGTAEAQPHTRASFSKDGVRHFMRFCLLCHVVCH